MKKLVIAVRCICILAFITGLADLVNGRGLLVLAGAHLIAAADDPVLNSQIRFWGAIWFGFGLILWSVSSDLIRNAHLFRLLCSILLLAGVARLVSLIQFGSPGPFLIGALGVELIFPSMVLFWHTRLTKRSIANGIFSR